MEDREPEPIKKINILLVLYNIFFSTGVEMKKTKEL